MAYAKLKDEPLPSRAGTASTGKVESRRSMFAVVKTGGKQYRVMPEDVLEIGKIRADVGEIVQLGEVLLVGGERPVLGAPTVQGASVAAEVLDHKRGPKIVTFKKRRRKNSRRKRGYRDEITVLRIIEILSDGAQPSIGPRSVRAKRPRDMETDAFVDRPSSSPNTSTAGVKGFFKKISDAVSATSPSRDTNSKPAEVESLASRDIVAELGNPDAKRRVAALIAAAEIVRKFDGSEKMEKSERLRQATFPRRMYAKLFDKDEHVARQAAYLLVVRSKSFGQGRVAGDVETLGSKEIDGIRQDLQRLLPKLGRRYFSYVTLKRVDTNRDALDASIRIRVSRALPFRMNDVPVIVDGGVKPASDDAAVKVMSLSSAQTEVKRRYKPGDKEWKNGDLFVADCRVHLPLKKGQVVKELPIEFHVDGLDAVKRELRLDRKPAHRAA